jgi:hypothetical protein
MKIKLLLSTALAVATTLVLPTVSSADPLVRVDWFSAPYVRSGFYCAQDEVMLGIHINQQKVICASLNYGYRIANRYYDAPWHTEVPGNMHGCMPDYVIQGLSRYGSNEYLLCASLKDAGGRPLHFAFSYVDGPGPDNNGTQSTIYGLDSPKMHVCPTQYAMAGIQVANNDLYCIF